MNTCSMRLGLTAVVVVVLGTPAAQAASLVAGSFTVNIKAVQDITLFTPNGPELLPDVTGYGSITFNYAAEVNGTLDITSLSGGMFYGSYPGLGNYVFGNIPPLTGADFSGSITNVVQNPNDPGYGSGAASSFQSGDLTFGGVQFGFSILGGPTFFTDPNSSFQFSLGLDGLPPSVGSEFVSSGPNDVLGVYAGTTEIGTSSNRRLYVVPEPSSVALLGIGVAVAFGYARRRKARVG